MIIFLIKALLPTNAGFLRLCAVLIEGSFLWKVFQGAWPYFVGSSEIIRRYGLFLSSIGSFNLALSSDGVQEENWIDHNECSVSINLSLSLHVMTDI